MKLRPPMNLRILAALAAVAVLCAAVAPGAWAQATIAPPGGSVDELGSPVPGGTEGTQTRGNYDYFTANLEPGLAKYLAFVTNRHVSERVWAQFRAGRYAATVADCQYALERFPNHPRALHLIGVCAKALNQPTVAIPYYEYALRLYPQYAFTHAQYGRYLVDIGAVQAGVSQFREALRIDPNQFQAKAWLAEVMAAHPELKVEEPAPTAAAPSNGKPATPKPAEPPKPR